MFAEYPYRQLKNPVVIHPNIGMPSPKPQRGLNDLSDLLSFKFFLSRRWAWAHIGLTRGWALLLRRSGCSKGQDGNLQNTGGPGNDLREGLWRGMPPKSPVDFLI